MNISIIICVFGAAFSAHKFWDSYKFAWFWLSLCALFVMIGLGL